MTKPLFALSVLFLAPLLVADDWTDYRGPKQNGVSNEKNLPSWSPTGEKSRMEVPYGGRSTPVIHGNHLYMLTASGKGETLQERLLCLDADTGSSFGSTA